MLLQNIIIIMQKRVADDLADELVVVVDNDDKMQVDKILSTEDQRWQTLMKMLETVNQRCLRIEELCLSHVNGNSSGNRKRSKVELVPPKAATADFQTLVPGWLKELNQSHLQLIFTTDYLDGVLKSLRQLFLASATEVPIKAVAQILYVVKDHEWVVMDETEYMAFMNAVLRQFRLLFCDWLKRHQSLIDESDEEFVVLWTTNSKKLSGGNITHEQMLLRLRKELCKSLK